MTETGTKALQIAPEKVKEYRDNLFALLDALKETKKKWEKYEYDKNQLPIV